MARAEGFLFSNKSRCLDRSDRWCLFPPQFKIKRQMTKEPPVIAASEDNNLQTQSLFDRGR